MERYSNFRDKSTGISPFMPVSQSSVIGHSDSQLQTIFKTLQLGKILGFLLLLIRIPLVVPLSIYSVVVSVIVGDVLVRPLNRVISFLSGLYGYELTVENLKTRQIRREVHYPSKDQLYFVNFTSPLDLLALLLISNDEFVVLVPDVNGGLRSVSKFELLKISVAGLDVSKTGESLNYNSLKGKVVYVFAEGTTSNGKAILPFLLKQSKFDEFLENSNIKKIGSIGIKQYPSTLVTPLQTSLLGYVYGLLTSWSLSLKIRINVINQSNPLEKSLLKIRSSFGNNGKFKLVGQDFDIEMKKKFIDTFKKK